MPAPSHPRWYNAVWRWHFYAGLLCMPFVLWLAATGTIYLWKPQIEAWLDRPHDQLEPAGPRATPEAQVSAALAAVPGSSLRKYQLPERPQEATRIFVANADGERRVLVDPYRLRVLRVERERDRPMRVVADLHGQLRAGNWGSVLVEVAACWTAVMLLTGLYLWWPRGRGLGGVLYPRLGRIGRGFWRDLHAVAGIWVAALALLLIATGLPWAKFWGGYLQEIRHVTGTADGPQDWPSGAPSAGTMPGDHAEHGHAAMHPLPAAGGELARVVGAAYPLGLAAPVLVAPPAAAGNPWTVTSDAANRPLRTRIAVDDRSGALLARRDFADRHWLDRVIGYGIAAHEGALFGIANQILGTFTALLLALLSVSGAVMWWRRRPHGLLGAPIPLKAPRFGTVLVAAVLLLALAMPLFGATLLAVFVTERTVLRRCPGAARWLGLRTSRA